MFELSPEKFVVLAVLALVVLGPDRLPRAARTLAKVLHQLRTTTASMQGEMREALAEPRKVLSDAMGEVGLPATLPAIPNVRSVVTRAITVPATAPSAGSAGAESVAAAGASVAAAPVTPPTTLPDDPGLN